MDCCDKEKNGIIGAWLDLTQVIQPQAGACGDRSLVSGLRQVIACDMFEIELLIRTVYVVNNQNLLFQFFSQLRYKELYFEDDTEELIKRYFVSSRRVGGLRNTSFGDFSNSSFSSSTSDYAGSENGLSPSALAAV